MPTDHMLEVRACPGVRRRTLCADSIAVFDPHSWKTHVVSGAAALLLTLVVERGVHRVCDLSTALSLEQAGFNAREAQALVDKALSELQSCELIELAAAAAPDS